MKKKVTKAEQIKKLVKKLGVQTDTFDGSGTRRSLSFQVMDNEDITGSISSLLEVCYFALDGQGSFVSPKHKNKTPLSSVAKVLEIVIDLLPHHHMFCLDKITEIVADENKKER